MTIPTVRRLADLITGKDPSLKRYDRPVLYWFTTLALAACVIGTVMDIADIHYIWGVNYQLKEGLHSTVSRYSSVSSYIDVKSLIPDIDQKLPTGMVADPNLPVSVSVAHSTLASGLLRLLSRVPMDLLVLSIVLLLRRIVLSAIGTDLSNGDPFIRANVRRLRIIAVLVALSVAIDLWSQIASSELVHRSLAKDISIFVYDASLWPLQLGAAMLIMILAEVFAVGVRLREDVEGLV